MSISNTDHTILNIILFTNVQIMYGMMCSILFIDSSLLYGFFSRCFFWSFNVALSKMLFWKKYLIIKSVCRELMMTTPHSLNFHLSSSSLPPTLLSSNETKLFKCHSNYHVSKFKAINASAKITFLSGMRARLHVDDIIWAASWWRKKWSWTRFSFFKAQFTINYFIFSAAFI